MHESGSGTFRTSDDVRSESALGGKSGSVAHHELWSDGRPVISQGYAPDSSRIVNLGAEFYPRRTASLVADAGETPNAASVTQLVDASPLIMRRPTGEKCDPNCRPAMRCRSNPVSAVSLPKTGIFAVVAGDFRQIGLGCREFGSVETVA